MRARARETEGELRVHPDDMDLLFRPRADQCMLGRKQRGAEWKAGARGNSRPPLRKRCFGWCPKRVCAKKSFALLCARVGETDVALKQLEAVTKIPGGPSYGELCLDPEWDPLRGDPRFEKIIASLAPKETVSNKTWFSVGSAVPPSTLSAFGITSVFAESLCLSDAALQTPDMNSAE